MVAHVACAVVTDKLKGVHKKWQKENEVKDDEMSGSDEEEEDDHDNDDDDHDQLRGQAWQAHRKHH